MTNGYNGIARIYDRLARMVFGKSIVQSQTIFLNRLQNCKTLLVLGGGTGWWLNDLSKMFPYLKITFVDSSSEMVRIARSKSDTNHEVNFVCGTIESIETNEKFDGVILYYFADLFPEEELSLIIQKIIMRMNSTSLWLVSDFVKRKRWHLMLLKLMYFFFRYSTGQKSSRIPDWQGQLEKVGLVKMDEHSFYNEFIQSDLYTLNKR